MCLTRSSKLDTLLSGCHPVPAVRGVCAQLYRRTLSPSRCSKCERFMVWQAIHHALRAHARTALETSSPWKWGTSLWVLCRSITGACDTPKERQTDRQTNIHAGRQTDKKTTKHTSRAILRFPLTVLSLLLFWSSLHDHAPSEVLLGLARGVKRGDAAMRVLPGYLFPFDKMMLKSRSLPGGIDPHTMREKRLQELDRDLDFHTHFHPCTVPLIACNVRDETTSDYARHRLTIVDCCVSVVSAMPGSKTTCVVHAPYRWSRDCTIVAAIVSIMVLRAGWCS